MDLRAIKVFVLVAKTLNFTHTAELLYTSPSSISKYISTLEDEVGKPLFKRNTRNVELTDYGKALLPYAEELWKCDQNMERFISMQTEEPEVQLIHFGLSQAIRVNPPVSKFDKILKAFARFRKEHPIFMTLNYLPEIELVKEVTGGSLQAALVWDKYFIHNPAYLDKLAYFRLMQEKRFLVFSAERFSGFQSVEDFRLIADKVLYAENSQSSESAHRLASLYFNHANLQPCSTWSEELIRIIAEEGIGFIEESLVELVRSVGLGCLPLDQGDYGMNLCIIWKKDCSDADTIDLVEMLNDAFFEK